LNIPSFFPALTNIKAYPQYNILDSTFFYEPYATNLDIHDIIVKDVQRDTSGIFSISVVPYPFYKSGILLLCEDSLKIHDISIDGIVGNQQIQLQYTAIPYYISTQSTINDMYNINISNTNTAKINFARTIKNSSFINVIDTTSTGVTNAVFVAGSKSVYRKYINKNPEFFDSTDVNNYYTEAAGSRAFEGFRTINKLSTGSADMYVQNSTGSWGALRQFPPASAISSSLNDNTGVFANRSLILISDGSVSSGGTGSIQFRTGGNTAGQERMRVYSNGNVVIKPNGIDSTSADLVVIGVAKATSGTMATLRGGIAASGTLTLSSTSDATKGKLLFGTSAYDEVNNRLGIGLTAPLYPLHVSGTVSGGIVGMIENLSTASGAGISASLSLKNSVTSGQVLKTGTGYTAYKTFSASDMGLYNSGAGNISILNDFASGNINFSTGGSSTSYLAISSAGNVSVGNVTATSTLHLQGSFSSSFTATAIDLTATIAHNVIAVTATSKTVTLPTAVGITGREYTIKLTASGTGTVATTSSQTIDGSTTYSLSAQYKYVTVKSDGANWIIIANN